MRIYDYRDVLKRIEHETETIDTTTMRVRLRGLIEEAALFAMPERDLVLKNAEIDIAQVEQKGYIEMPCDISRLLRITHNGELVNWRRTTANIFPPAHVKSGSLVFYYYSVDYIEDPVEGQLIAISKDCIDYCAYTAIATVLQDKMIMNPALGTLLQIMNNKAAFAFAQARNSLRGKTITDIEQELSYTRTGDFLKRR